MRESERVSELVRRDGEQRGHVPGDGGALVAPPLVVVKVDVAAAPAAREEGVRQDGAGAVELVPVPVVPPVVPDCIVPVAPLFVPLYKLTSLEN